MNATENEKPAASQTGYCPTYVNESARPLVSLAFVLPLLLVYELGLLVMGTSAVRNGADALMRHLLDSLGFGQYFLLPVLTCAVLLGWHHVRREPWLFSARVLPVMFVEAVAWAALLLILWRLLGLVDGQWAAAMAVANETRLRLARLVAFCGAGLYEELLFRLILLSAVAGGLRLAGVPRRYALVAAVVMTSLVFSAAHYRPLIPGGEVFAWSSFVFRFLAGVFFAVVFIQRGFGIAAGCHAFYDVIAQELYRFP